MGSRRSFGPLTSCARCDFYAPKHSSKGQFLEAKDNLQRMLATIPPTDEEQAAACSPPALPSWARQH
ncbi:hypothetical protein ABT040_39040 [Streptomyces sp. NPDC002688]|uniref:hypothetical protein n=1 Tax=Streptomyces sp. NPDC002688 TaxID=3154423 RepID=UPI0033324EEF